MRSFNLVLAIFCLASTASVYSQDNLPPAGQPGSQPRQSAAQQAFGQAGQSFSNAPGNAAPGGAQDPAYQQQVSYGLGRNFAMNLRDLEFDFDFNSLMAGISDALRGSQPKYGEQQLEATLERFSKEMQQKQLTRMQQTGAKNKQEAATFLAQNGRQQGVQTTPSGLQYRVLKQGNGPSPTAGDVVRCNYRGTLLNGTEFDKSAPGKPAEFSVGEVIDGWKEALQKMHVGDKWQLFVPPNLAYDMRPPRPPIEPGHMLVFEIELLDIVKK